MHMLKQNLINEKNHYLNFLMRIVKIRYQSKIRRLFRKNCKKIWR